MLGGIRIGWQQRVLSGLTNIPWGLLLLISNVTPLIFVLPQPRTWLYQTLLKSKVFALGGVPTPGRISLGLRIWDTINAYSILLAVVSGPVLMGLVSWLVLDLSQVWSKAEPASLEKVSVAQILTAVLVGGVALDVFFITALPQLMRPRVHACFLRTNPNNLLHIQGYFEEFTEEETLCSPQKVCLHLRIANTGFSHLPKLDLAIRVPSELLVPGDTVPGTPVFHIEKHHVSREGDRISFAVRDNPLDTAPGAAAVYHFIVVPTTLENEACYTLHLRVASERSNGFTEKQLRLKVKPHAVQA